MFRWLKSAARGVAGTANDAVSAGLDTVSVPLSELYNACPTLERVGYRLGETEVAVTLPPRISATFHRVRVATAADYEAALATSSSSRTIRTVLGLLQRADHILERLPLAGRRCSAVILELTLVPSIRLIYTPPGSQPPTAVGVQTPPQATSS